SETTAAQAGEVGKLRFAPMAMLPFCGYNMAAYLAHWLGVGERDGAELPKVFHVNWFRKDEDGNFLWPGFGENSRVLEWVFRRCNDQGETVDSVLGLLPAEGELNVDGLEISPEAMGALLSVDDEAVAAQLPQLEEHLARFGDDLPEQIGAQLDALKQRLG
ncbi:MAG: phosphoenolpyruvate carboxykinase (GTP), partial [Actinomycetota bacterium]|nr:phosphoenolpyruvate carboxykinase (GTP) [Actinomycetota bacterium]